MNEQASNEQSTPVDTSVPLDVHPDTVKQYASMLNVPGTSGPKALASAKEAMTSVYGLLTNINPEGSPQNLRKIVGRRESMAGATR